MLENKTRIKEIDVSLRYCLKCKTTRKKSTRRQLTYYGHNIRKIRKKLNQISNDFSAVPDINTIKIEYMVLNNKKKV